MGIEAPWVGCTREEYEGVTEYVIDFSMRGSIVIAARDSEEAIEKFRDMSYSDLYDCIGDVEIDEVSI